MYTKFNQKAFELFRQWTKFAKLIYSELNFEIIDETLLVEDLKRCFYSAIDTLQNEEKIENRKQLGYDYGYIIGFVRSNLNVSWHHQYIEKQSNEYKMYLVHKSMEQFFRLDSLTVERLTKLYFHLLYDKQNIMNLNEDIEPIKLTSVDVALINESKENPILEAINNQINSYINKYLSSKKENFMPDIRNYFSYTEIAWYFKNYKPL